MEVPIGLVFLFGFAIGLLYSRLHTDRWAMQKYTKFLAALPWNEGRIFKLKKLPLRKRIFGDPTTEYRRARKYLDKHLEDLKKYEL